MHQHDRSAPIWLFSFVDLAFLLLIVFTQISPESNASDIEIGQLEIPRIKSSATPIERNDAAPLWQLRIYPIEIADDASDIVRTPFELVEPGVIRGPHSQAQVADSPLHKQIDATELASHLRLLRERKLAKPLLAPHRNSRSEDLLIAVGLLEETWQSNRVVTVVPGVPGVVPGLLPDFSVASGSGDDGSESQ